MSNPACPDCGNDCVATEKCGCCFWCCVKCQDYGCSYCKNFYHERTVGSSKDPCNPSDCKKQCVKCTKRNCKCPCCKDKSSTSASSESLSADSRQYVTDEESDHLGYTYAEPSLSPNVLPYIIVPVALIIVVICVMCVFRIRPFHKLRDFSARKMNG